ncbi:MAG: cation-translocating P-type ATPase, partial [Chloroflexi bacterium]
MKERLQTLSPTQKRLLLVISSGSLIAAGWAVGNLFDRENLSFWLMAAAAALAGADIGIRAVRLLLKKHISIELLVTIAAVGALFLGEVWESAVVTFLFVFGAYLEARTLSRTRQVIASLLDLAPITAIVLRHGRQMEVSPGEVGVGEIVLVKPGGKIPVDGDVIEGSSPVNESAITGEPMPEEKGPGSKVFAGTINGFGLLKLKVTGTGMDTTLARIIRRVEEAQDDKAPAQRFIEHFARWYTPSIIVLSIALFLFTRDLDLALTMLVIACPGALVISTPVSVVAGIGKAARSGILIIGGEYLENAGKISAVAFDKPGTLTAGQPRVTEVIALQLAPVLSMVGNANPAWKESNSGNRWSTDQQETL